MATDNFGELLRNARLKAGLRQSEIEEKAGLNHGWVSQLERGRRLPSYKTLCNIIDVLGVKADALF